MRWRSSRCGRGFGPAGACQQLHACQRVATFSPPRRSAGSPAPAPARAGFGFGHQAMAGHRHEQGLHVFGHHMPAAKRSACALAARSRASPARGDRPTRTPAWCRLRVSSACTVDQRVAGMHLANRFTQCTHLGVVQLWHRACDQVAAITAAQQLALGLRAGVAIASRSGNDPAANPATEGAGQVDRVLRGDDEERIGRWMCLSIQCDLLLGHRFQQRTLCPRRCTVDLIGQQHVGEHRAGMELELAAAGLVHETPVRPPATGRR